jgi:hypothetical protein
MAKRPRTLTALGSRGGDMTKRTKKGGGARKDLDPKVDGKKVKGGVQISDMVFNQLSPSDSQNLKKATRDLTLGVVNPK